MTWGVSLLVSYHFAFSYCSWGSQGKNTEVACLSLLQWTTFCQTSPPWPTCLRLAWFHWVRQGCGPSVIRLTSFLWVWFQCVCPLMPSCNTYHLTWVSLILGVSLHGCSSKAQPLLLTLDEGYLLTTDVPDLQLGIAPLGPPVPVQPPHLGQGVARLGRPPDVRHGLTPLGRCPDLGRGVTLLGHA